MKLLSEENLGHLPTEIVEVCIPVTVSVWGWPQPFTEGCQTRPRWADGWLEQVLLCLTRHLDQPPSR